MATLQTKWVNIGSLSFYNITLTGKSGSGFGTISNTQNGSSNEDLDSVFSGADVQSLYHTTAGTGYVTFVLTGNRPNSTFATLKIGSLTLARTAASYSYNSGSNITSWIWSQSSTPFSGGNNADKEITWDDGQASVSAPTTSSVTFNNPASANTTATVALSAPGGGGTLQYACEAGDPTPDNWQTGNTFTISRYYYGTVYARARRSSSAVSNTVNAARPGFLIGDTGVNPSNSTIAHNATAASTVVTYGTYGEAYSVRVNNGSTNLGATIANSVGTATISFTSSLPTAGNTTTYEIFVRRPTSTGGDGSAYHATDDTFTVTRSAAPDTTPNAFSFTDVTNVALSSVQTSNTITVAGLNTSTSVSISGGTYSKNGGGYTSANTTAVNGNTFAVRHTASGSFSTAASCTLNIGGVTDAYSSTTLAADSTPNAFAFTDKTGNVGTEQNSSALITGINTSSTVSRSYGTATFAVSASASTPAAGSFDASAKTVNGYTKYVHVKQNASTSYSTTLSSSFAVGGVSDIWYVTSNAFAADTVPDQFSFTDVTTALSTVSYSYAQITAISTGITVSRSSGAATFAVSSSTSVPSSGSFNTSNKTITNNQYIHVKQTSSSSSSTTLSSVFAAGGVSATWNLITVGSSGSGAGYGLQVFPPSGTIPRLDTTDRTVRVLGVHTGTLASAGSSSTVTQAGFSSSDATIGVEWQTSGNPEYFSLSSSGTSLTIARSSNDPSSFSYQYQLRIFRI